MSDLKWFIFSYFPDSDGKLRSLPKSKRKAPPSQFIQLGRDDEATTRQAYKMMHKHVSTPLLTEDEYVARMCDRPMPGIRPIKAEVSHDA